MGATHFSGPVVSPGGFTGDLTGDVTGNVTGNVTGDITGEVTGDIGGAAVTTGAGAGITAGVGTVIATEITKVGKVVNTHIFIDITGLSSSATNGDVIGVDDTGAAYLLAVDFAESGQVFAGAMTCLEAPTTGDPDIDLYAADEATGVEDSAIGDLTETALVASAASWTLNRQVAFTGWPTDGQYLYLTVGNTGVAGAYASGQFLIELWGYEA